MEQLKPKEQRVLDFINKTIDEQGYPPSVREVCAALGFKSTSTVQMYVNRLISKGYLLKSDGKSRTIRKVEELSDSSYKYKIPVVGQVAAGTPILATQNYDGYITYSSQHSHDEASLFALKVKGESMIEIGIMDGDYVIVDQRNYAENGEIVVALVEDEATVKRFYKEHGRYRLQPENKTMEPIIVDSVSVLGKVIAVIRYYA